MFYIKEVKYELMGNEGSGRFYYKATAWSGSYEMRLHQVLFCAFAAIQRLS